LGHNPQNIYKPLTEKIPSSLSRLQIMCISIVDLKGIAHISCNPSNVDTF
jgi:hypothetical protein